MDPCFVEKGSEICVGELEFLTVDGGGPAMWRVLRSGRRGVFECVKGLGDIPGHGNVNKSFFVIPGEVETEIRRTGPVGGVGVTSGKGGK